MSIHFAGVGNNIAIQRPVLLAAPITLHCWFNADHDTDDHVFVGIYDDAAPEERFDIQARGTAGNICNATAKGATGQANANTGNTFTPGKWHNLIAHHAATNLTEIWLDDDDANKGSSTVAIGTMNNLDATGIATSAFAVFQYAESKIAEVGIWNVVLSPQERTKLAAGYSPLFIRPESLVLYLPMINGDYKTDYSLHNDMLFELTGSITPMDHPHIIYPRGSVLNRTQFAFTNTSESIVTGSITFSSNLDQVQVHQLTGLTALTFLTNLTQAQSNVKTTEVSQTFGLTLDQLQEYGALVLGAFTFGLTMQQVETVNKITSNAETFSITLQQVQELNKITSEVQGFDLILDETNLVTKITDVSNNFDVNLDEVHSNVSTRNVSFSAQIDLNELETNQADKVVEFLSTLTLDQQQSNIKTSEGIITFTADLDYNILNQLAANLNITLTTDLDYQFSADGAGIINGAITFLANLDQVESNIITADKAMQFTVDAAQAQDVQLDKLETLSLIIEASDSYINARGLTGAISLDTQLEQLQSNSLDKVLLMSFNALLDKTLSTQGSTWGTLVNFATTLSSNFGTEGDISAAITFMTVLDQQLQTNKITDVSMGFGVDADIITEIRLIVEGQVSLSTIMDQTEAKQLLGNSGITFGHIQGLSSLGNSILGEDIDFSTIQQYQTNGFIAQFTLITPNERILKVYIEDRTITVNGDPRAIVVTRTN